MPKTSRLFQFFSLLILSGIFLAGPLVGAMMRGEPATSYLQFPPTTTMTDQASFSWIAFLVVLTFLLATTWPFWRRLGRGRGRIEHNDAARRKRNWPWWGWLALGSLLAFWVLAWTRFPWFEPFQRYTFFPLWFSFIVLLNAIAVWRWDRSLATHHPRYFTLLFPVSAVFWWGFEYLNRFVNNWHYLGLEQIGGGRYFVEATLAFSTVLPAVMSVRFLLLKVEAVKKNYRDFPAAPWLTSLPVWGVAGIAAVFALVLIGWVPRLTYPLIWIVPGLLWISWQRWRGYLNPMLRKTSEGDYTLLWSAALAALICGFFWELWNVYSAAKWVYSIPALDGFEVFEMPLIGYAGYLPFGVICALIARSLLSTLTGDDETVPGQEDEIQLKREVDQAGL